MAYSFIDQIKPVNSMGLTGICSGAGIIMLKTAGIGKGGVGVNTNVPKTDNAKTVATKKDKKKITIGEFVRQVRTETRRVTWPSRRETGITTMMVFFMVLFCAIFFLIADQIIIWTVRAIIDLGG